MNILAANQTHVDDWLALRGQVYSGLDEAFHRQEIAQWLASAQRSCWIAYEGGQAVGLIEASLRNIVDGCLSSPVGYVEGIFVASHVRGQGLARRLLSTAATWMRDLGCTEMATDAELHNQQAIAFHRAMGFEETYRTVGFRQALDPAPSRRS